MANIKGGQLKAFPLVGTAQYKPESKGADGKIRRAGYIVDAQLDMRSPRSNPGTQTNPHLDTHQASMPDGNVRTLHGRWMDEAQGEAILKGAGAKHIYKGKGLTEKMGDGSFAFAITADLTYSKDRKNLVIDTSKEIKPGLGKSMTQKVLDEQAALVKTAKDNQKAARAADRQVETPAAEAEAEAQAEAKAEAQAEM